MVKESSCNFIDVGITELLGLFRDELATTKFPGVDATTLDAAVAAVAKQADAVEALRLAHQEAVEALRTQQRALRDHARQAHAYARVFARDNGALSAQLDSIVLDEPMSAPPKKRRGRKPKSVKTAPPQLALDSAPAAKVAPATKATKAA